MGEGTDRFGVGQAFGLLGAGALALSVTQPWLQLGLADQLSRALAQAPAGGTTHLLLSKAAGGAFSGAGAAASPAGRAALSHHLGIHATGWDQQRVLAIILIAAAGFALLGVVRSLLAHTVGDARREGAPLLSLAGFAAILVALLERFLLMPQPRAAISPTIGLWIALAGGITLLIASWTLGGHQASAYGPPSSSSGPPQPQPGLPNESLAYSQGAWVPRQALKED